MIGKIFKIESGAVMSDKHDGNGNNNIIYIKGEDSVPPESEPEPEPKPKLGADILSFWDKQKGTIIATVIGTLLSAAIIFLIVNFYFLPRDVGDLESDIKGLKEQIEQLTASVKSNGDGIVDVRRLIELEQRERENAILKAENDIKDEIIRLISPTELRSTESMAQAIRSCADYDTFGNGSGALPVTTLVAYNIVTYKEYSVEEIANQKMLLPYRDGKKEGYFYGQLSETGAWDGDCVINVYEGGKLIFIKEATYDNGYLLRSRQVFSYIYSEGQKVWAISDRINYGDHSEGETQIYKWEQDYTQRFETGKIAPKDIIDIEAFQKGLSPDLFAYYYGSTSDGYFNDKSGASYMVRFWEDGTVRWLYVGNFEEGHFNDSTGNAWQIVKDKDTDYMYYKGKFKDDKVVDLISSFSPPLSLDQIKEIIGDRTFNVELHWDKLGVT